MTTPTECVGSPSIDDQIRACAERAEREGWKVSATYSDAAIQAGAGQSGQAFERLCEIPYWPKSAWLWWRH